MTLTQFRRSSATLAALAACIIAGTAYAGSPAEPSVAVPFGDLNLTTERGADALYARLTAAARQVCAGNGLDIRDLQAYAAARSCESQAIARAVHAVQAPKVAARLAARHEHG